MDHITLYAQLLKERINHPENPAYQIIKFKELTRKDITVDELTKAFEQSKRPPMNQIVPQLINLGFKPKQLEQLFETTQSNISHAKKGGFKRPYTNNMFMRILEGAYKYENYKQVKYGDGRRNLNVDYEEDLSDYKT